MKLGELKSTRRYPRGKTLFFEGQRAGGVYVLCSGRIKLSTHSEEGKAIIARVVEPGEVLALSAIVNGTPHEGTASAIDDCLIGFINKRDFENLLNSSPLIALKAMKELGRVYRKAYTRICTLGLSTSVSGRLTRLFLEWCDLSPNGGESATIRQPYTHEEIAEMIGTSRETVTRLLRTFRERGLIDLEDGMLHIPNKNHLRSLVSTGKGHADRAAG
ncbi:MAG: Crp/Fnr family transcriptional regulator [Acidobacteriota bacterium]